MVDARIELNTEHFKEYTCYLQDAKFTVVIDRQADHTVSLQDVKNDTQLHFHSHFELFYVNGEELTLLFEDGPRSFRKNALIIVSPFVNHRMVVRGGDTSRYSNISFHMEKLPNRVKSSLFQALKEIMVPPYIHLQGMPELYSAVVKTAQSIALGDELRLSLHFYRLIMEVVNCSDREALAVSAASEGLSDSDMMRSYKLQRVIYKHYKQDISLGYVAQKLYLSTKQTSRLIQKIYGCSYRDLINRLRTKEAAELLVAGRLTVRQIAARVGYKSVKGFYDAFKRQYGCLPSYYRKERKHENAHAEK